MEGGNWSNEARVNKAEKEIELEDIEELEELEEIKELEDIEELELEEMEALIFLSTGHSQRMFPPAAAFNKIILFENI